MTAQIDMSETYAEIVEGPLYVRSERVEQALRPHMPSGRDMTAEFRAHLHRCVHGVEVVERNGTGRALIVPRRDGAGELVPDEYRRLKMYARMLVPYESVEAAGDGAPEKLRASGREEIRQAALAVARLYAERIGEQVKAKRVEIGGDAPVLVTCHSPLPMLIGESQGEPRFFVDECTDRVGALFAAYYFVTPVGDA
jgi:hypothetical protein